MVRYFSYRRRNFIYVLTYTYVFNATCLIQIFRTQCNKKQIKFAEIVIYESEMFLL